MKKILIALGVVVVLIVGALLVIPLFISTDTVKNELVARIEAATGRKVRLDGPISISLITGASLTAKGIGLAGPEGSGEAFSVDALSVGVSLLPLISGNVEINGVTLEKPVILVETDANGATNWDSMAGGGSASEAPAAEGAPGAAGTPGTVEDLINGAPPAEQPAPEATAPTPAPAADGGSTLDRLSLGRITIVDGTLIYRDKAGGSEQKIEKLNLAIDLPKVSGAGTAEGSFAYNGMEQTIKLAVGERPAADPFARIPIDLTLGSGGLTVNAKGTALDGDTLFAGTVAAAADSLQTAAASFGASLPDAPGFGKFAASTEVTVANGQAQLKKLAADFGGTKIAGAAAVAYERAVPGVALKLHADSIDATAFTAPATSPADAAGGSASGGSASGGGGDGGGGGDAGGASDSVDLSALAAIDANADFSADEVVLGTVALKNLGLDIKLSGGAMTTTIRSVEVGGAPGSGTIVLDGRGTPAASGALKLAGLDIGALAALAGTTAPFSGVAGMDVSFKTGGPTFSALIENLQASGKVSLADGKVSGLGIASYVGGDAAADSVEDMDLTASFASVTSPVDVTGAITWRGERFDVSASTDPRAFTAGKQTAVAVKATSKRVNLGFDGTAGLSGVGSGKVSLSTPSLRDLLAWIGHPISAGGGLQEFSIAGAVKLTDTTFSFDNAALSLDGSSGVGTGKVDFGGKLGISAGLSMKVLDVSPYLAASGVKVGSGGGNAGGGGGGKAGKGGGGGWSTAPIGFDGLKAIEAKLNVAAEQIIAGDIKIGKSALTATVTGGKLTANLTEMALYSGSGVGVINVDGAAATPGLDASFQLANVEALPFLSDAIGFTRIEGTGSFNFDIASAGASQAALMQAMSGKGAVRFANGAIRGIDIPKMVQTLSVQTLMGWQASNDKTAFDDMSATFTIANGIVTNNDLTMSGPLFSVTGAGTIRLPEQKIAYRVDPKVMADFEGKKGKGKDGFAVPIRIEGSWYQPQIYPEIEGILKDPKSALDQLKQLGGGLFGSGGGKQKGGKKAKNLPDADAGVVDSGAPADASAAPAAGEPAADAGAPAADQPDDAAPKKKKKKKTNPADAIQQLLGQ